MKNNRIKTIFEHTFLDTLFPMKKVALYARVSTQEQHTLLMQMEAMKQYINHRKWELALQIEEVGSGSKERTKRETILKAARRRNIDVVVVWKLDRWGRSVADLTHTLHELYLLGVGFISITEALDFTTPSGKAMAGMLAVFAQFERDILSERIKAGMQNAKQQGKNIGRPISVGKYKGEVKKLFEQGVNKSQIAHQLSIPRTTVIRLLKEK